MPSTNPANRYMQVLRTYNTVLLTSGCTISSYHRLGCFTPVPAEAKWQRNLGCPQVLGAFNSPAFLCQECLNLKRSSLMHVPAEMLNQKKVKREAQAVPLLGGFLCSAKAKTKSTII